MSEMTWRQMNPWRSDRVDLGFQRRSVRRAKCQGRAQAKGPGCARAKRNEAWRWEESFQCFEVLKVPSYPPLSSTPTFQCLRLRVWLWLAYSSITTDILESSHYFPESLFLCSYFLEIVLISFVVTLFRWILDPFDVVKELTCNFCLWTIVKKEEDDRQTEFYYNV